MKICVLTHTFPRFENDTAAPFMDGVAGGLAEAGNEVFVLTPYTPSFKSLPNRNYKIVTYKYIFPDFLHKLGYSQTLSNDKELKISMYLLSPFMYLFGTIALIRLTKKEKIDLVNAHWILPNGFIACLASLFTGVPVVSTLPGSDVLMVRKNRFFRQLGVFAVKKSKTVTSNSPQLLIDLKELTDVTFRSEAIIYGVDPDKFKPTNAQTNKLKKELNIPKDHKVVIGVGRLVEKKGFVYLIKAASLLIKKYPKVTYIIVGDGDLKNNLIELAKKENLQNNFRFPGAINYKDLIYYYNLSDIFILPSIRDASGNLDDQSVAAIEAMACGKPVVCTDFPGYRIATKPGVNGYLTKEGDPESIVQALDKLLGNSELCKKMGKESRKLIEDKFSWNAIGKEYTGLFEKIISK